MKVINKIHLTKFFNRFFSQSEINLYEQNSKGFEDNNRFYKDTSTSYSYQDIETIINKILIPFYQYQTIIEDFKSIYIKRVQEFNKDKIKLSKE